MKIPSTFSPFIQVLYKQQDTNNRRSFVWVHVCDRRATAHPTKYLHKTPLQQECAIAKWRSCSLEAHYWCCRSWAPYSPNQRKNFLHPAALLYPAPGKRKEGQKHPQNSRERKDRDEKFYLVCLPLHRLLILPRSHMKYLVFPLNQWWQTREFENTWAQKICLVRWFEIPMYGISWAGSCSHLFSPSLGKGEPNPGQSRGWGWQGEVRVAPGILGKDTLECRVRNEGIQDNLLWIKRQWGKEGRYRQVGEWIGRGRDCFPEKNAHILVPRG